MMQNWIWKALEFWDDDELTRDTTALSFELLYYVTNCTVICCRD